MLWEGSFFAWHSLAHINRELCVRLHQRNVVDAIRTYDQWVEEVQPPQVDTLKSLVQPDCAARLTIRHSFPPNLGESQGDLVLMQPWEFLRAPKLWVDAVRGPLVRELWVNSEFTRSSYVLAGAPPEKVRVMPLGFDEDVFQPGENPESDEFRFLYVGGTIERKGIDILMSAYLAEFRRNENVRLIIKDTGSKHVYSHANHVEPITSIVNDPNAACVELITEDLEPEALARLMQSCHCIVQPYRAEGFCMPVLEGMAFGLVPIVTLGGPTDDFVPPTAGFKIASRHVQISQTWGLESTEPQGWLEPDAHDLRQLMRRAFTDPDELRAKREAGIAEAAKWTWERAADTYEARIKELLSPVVKPRNGQASISLCMIVKNEERVLEECLRSAVHHFDQIIIVDTGSTDATKEICYRFGVDLRESTWPDSFAEARNQSMIRATGDWIMWIDADDTLPEGCMDHVRGAIAAATADVVGFVIPVRFKEEGGFGTEVDHVKVFRNFPGLKWEGRIHEQILPSLRALAREHGFEDGGKIARLPTYVFHSGYDTSESGQARKRERDTHLLKLDLEDRPGHPFVLFNLGMTAHYTDDHEAAVRWFEQSLANSHPGDSHVRKAYALLGASLRRLGQLTEARQRLSDGLAQIPGEPEIHFHLAQLCADEGDHDSATQHYQAVLGAEIRGAFTSLDPGILGYKTHHNLALSYLAKGDYPSAREQWRQALAATGRAEIAFTLFDSALEHSDLQAARDMLLWTETNQGHGESWANMALRLCERTGLDPLVQLGAAIQRSPHPNGVKKVLAKYLLNAGRKEEAVPLLDEMQSHGDAEGAYFLGVLAEEHEELEKALRWFERAAALNPAHTGTLSRIASLKSRLKI
ncbi:MAG: glycosyltransferase [Fimbriimonadaceae bacterium]|nr:glycosyltransferase [Fimbriimonadaceae bacterium]